MIESEGRKLTIRTGLECPSSFILAPNKWQIELCAFRFIPPSTEPEQEKTKCKHFRIEISCQVCSARRCAVSRIQLNLIDCAPVSCSARPAPRFDNLKFTERLPALGG